MRYLIDSEVKKKMKSVLIHLDNDDFDFLNGIRVRNNTTWRGLLKTPYTKVKKDDE